MRKIEMTKNVIFTHNISFISFLSMLCWEDSRNAERTDNQKGEAIFQVLGQ